MDENTFQVDSIDIACEDDVHLDSSLDETEELAENMDASPCKVTDAMSDGTFAFPICCISSLASLLF